MEWTSNGPRSNLESGLVPGGRSDSALMVIQDVPFTGAGMSTFSGLSERVYFIMIGDEVLTEISSAHNGFLQTAVDLGVPGLVTYVALWVASVRTLWILLRRRHDGATDQVAIGCLGALAAAWVYQITDAIPLGAKVGALWWITLGIVHSLGRVAPDRDSPGGNPRDRVIASLLLLVLSSILALWVVSRSASVGIVLAVLGGSLVGYLAGAERQPPALSGVPGDS